MSFILIDDFRRSDTGSCVPLRIAYLGNSVATTPQPPVRPPAPVISERTFEKNMYVVCHEE